MPVELSYICLVLLPATDIAADTVSGLVITSTLLFLRMVSVFISYTTQLSAVTYPVTPPPAAMTCA